MWRNAICKYSTQRVYAVRAYPASSRVLITHARTFRTINAAITQLRDDASARAGDAGETQGMPILLLLPGIYEESVVMDTPVRIYYHFTLF